MSESANTYQCKITEAMTWLGKQKKAIFLGEGLINAGRIYNTLDNVPNKKCIEFPICENLIVGSAMGLTLEGYKPIVVFQRMDFMLIGADAIINHLALMPKMSGGQFDMPVIIRVIIGSRNPMFDVGPQHKHDFTHVFTRYIETVSVCIDTDIMHLYRDAFERKEPILIVEDRDMYEREMKNETDRCSNKL